VMKPDDSSLEPNERRAVEKVAQRLLNRAEVWDRFPTPIDEILEAAQLTVAPRSAFDPRSIMEFVRGKTEKVTETIKAAVNKVLGIYDAEAQIIHINSNVAITKQRFLKLHETGHHEIPTHRKVFRFFQDCEKTLSPDVADLFEREANNFARFALFQGDRYATIAADYALEVKSPMALAKKFGASIYASAREFARTNHRACMVVVLNPIEICENHGFRAPVRRVECSPSFFQQFGQLRDITITPDHWLGGVLPLGRKMSGPTLVIVADRAGVIHECVGEAFDTTHNIIVLLYPVKALTKSTIVLPPNFTQSNSALVAT
jgi:hypothetical protein